MQNPSTSLLRACCAVVALCLAAAAGAQQRPVKRQDPGFVAVVQESIPDFDILVNDKGWEPFLQSKYGQNTNSDLLNYAHNTASLGGIRDVFDRFRAQRERQRGAADDGPWKIYAANEDNTARFFYNQTALVKQPPYVVVWIRADTIGPATVDKAFTQRLIDCNKMNFTLLRYENTHNEELASKGEIAEAAQTISAITPGSAMETVTRKLCAPK
ncbi:hypothetical protein ACDA63_13925 [Uliginosibacterium sp. sgz301328]|uniref:hypothetical protein n=1 Tax=Uliginosibacterium sp. sgz301328 TaxID=3243764 RepID=UPI00359DD878